MIALRCFAAVLLVATAPLAAVASASAATVAYASASAADGEQLVAGARMSALANKVAGQLISDPDRALVVASPVTDQYVPDGAVAIAVQTPQVNPSYVAVPMHILVNGRVVRTVVAGYRVEQYVHTAVASHDLAPGTILTADDLTMARVLSTGRPGVDVGALAGRRMRAAANRGALVYVEQTAEVNLVRSGSGVILIVRDGPVQLTADVIARTDGGLGDSVTVYNAKTNKVLSGTVVGPNQVELELPGDDE
jgi:flagella basal body P-ring formation protein FlgA